MPVQPTLNNGTAYLQELFSSIQGEGVLVGLRQVFLRFQGCPLCCRYCDTPETSETGDCLVESTPGRRDFIPFANPVSHERIVETIARWNSGWPGIHHSISITGGEPLLNFEAVAELAPLLRKHLPVYLETSGIMHAELSQVIEHIDLVGMDIKLPSTSGYQHLWDDHQRFLEIANSVQVHIKAVVDDTTEDWEITKSCELVASVNRRVPFILQPLTDRDGKIGISPLKVLEFQEIASRILSEVRVIPQTHKFMGQL